MFETIQSYLPSEWQRTVEFLGAPLWWIPEWQEMVLAFTMFGSGTADTIARRTLLFLPALTLVVGVWVSAGSLYTVPFRRDRGRFLTTITMTWWDAGRSVWFFWAGLLQLTVLLLGWIWSTLKLAGRLLVEGLRGLLQSPFVALDWTARRYFKPGMPWLAFLLTMGWSALEATIFTYTLLPTMIDVLANITGFEPNRAVVAPILWTLLALLIAGSFACIDVLTQSIRQRDAARITQMLFVEFFVMFFEVVFLYRELVDAITPWIAQQTGGTLQLGLTATLLLAAFGWLGIRGMTWFLFGRYGTPAVLAVLSRETLTYAENDAQPSRRPTQQSPFREAVGALKAETAWFRDEARTLFEMVTLPVFQLLAAAVNFIVVLLRGEPAFSLPFRSLDDVLAAAPFPGADAARAKRRNGTVVAGGAT
jgi:hypothetical protein